MQSVVNFQPALATQGISFPLPEAGVPSMPSCCTAASREDTGLPFPSRTTENPRCSVGSIPCVRILAIRSCAAVSAWRSWRPAYNPMSAIPARYQMPPAEGCCPHRVGYSASHARPPVQQCPVCPGRWHRSLHAAPLPGTAHDPGRSAQSTAHWHPRCSVWCGGWPSYALLGDREECVVHARRKRCPGRIVKSIAGSEKC